MMSTLANGRRARQTADRDGVITEAEFKIQRGTEQRTTWQCSNACIRSMSLADDRIDDCDIGPLWAEHFPKIATEVCSKVLVLSLVYIIEGKAKADTMDGDWADSIHQELRRHRISADEFWEIQSTTRR